jgi:hypothetical protein
MNDNNNTVRKENKVNLEAYENMKKKSVTGQSTRRTRKKTITIEYDKFVKKMKVMIGTTAVVVAILAGTGPIVVSNAYNKIVDNIQINELVQDFESNVIVNETHRTDDNEHFYYDYSDIAKKIENMEDFDKAVYLLDQSIGYYQTGKTLAHTDYGSFTNYLEEKGYADEDEFKKDMRQRILLENEIDKKQQELNRMQEEHSSNLENTIENENSINLN